MAVDTLSMIAEAITSLLGDSIKDRLKPKTSIDIAKAKVLELYQVLDNINEETTDYIGNFEIYLSVIDSGESKETLEALKERLKSSVIDIWELIKKLQRALDNINPQLEIHQHDLAESMKAFRRERLGILAIQSYETRSFQDTNQRKPRNKAIKLNRKKILETEDTVELRKILSKVKQNQRSIVKITSEFRDFIANEFDFKDSF